MKRQKPEVGGGVGRQRGVRPNEKAGTDAGDLAALPLLGKNITDKEGEAPKKKYLAAVAAPAEAITAGVVATDAPKKTASVADEAFSFFSSINFSPETETVPPCMAE